MFIEKYRSKICRIDVEKGWKDLIEEFLEKFETLNKSNLVEIAQIKQKMGECRIYVHLPEWFKGNPSRAEKWSIYLNPNGKKYDEVDSILNLITEYENKCNITCESCGCIKEDVTFRRPRFWIFKFCEKCYLEKCFELKVENVEPGKDVSNLFKI